MADRDDALFQASFAALHLGGLVFFAVGVVLSGLGFWYHASRFWRVVR